MRPILFLILLNLLISLSWGSSFKNPALVNTREGSSFYLRDQKLARTLEDAYRLHAKREFRNFYLYSLREHELEGLCSFRLNELLAEHALLELPKVSYLRFDNLLYAIRATGVMDDVTLSLLLKAWMIQKSLPVASEFIPADITSDHELYPFKRFYESQEKGCLSKTYRALYSSFRRNDEDYTEDELLNLAKKAFDKKVIDKRTYLLIKQSKEQALLSWRLNLDDYATKINVLREQRPIPLFERSDFVTQSFDKSTASSVRMKLFERYSFQQIIYLGEVIKKMVVRLNSPRMEVNVFDHEDNIVETYSLGPMDRFDYATSMLRKEMSALSASEFLFKGQAPGYMELIVAAFETGVVGKADLDQIAALEELWRPTPGFWDRAQIWVRTFGSIAAAVAPAPYNILPVLGVVIMQALLTDPSLSVEHKVFKD